MSWNKEQRRIWRAANRDKVNAQKRAYREANRNKIRAEDKAWYEANRDKRLEKMRLSYEKNPEPIIERAKAWYAANKQQKQAYDQNYYLKNKETKSRQMRSWREENPELVKQLQLRRKQREYNAHGHASTEQIRARMDFFGNKCSYCPDGAYEHLEHAIPLVRGGTNWPANLRPSCGRCNDQKGRQTIFEFLRKTRGV